jgi:hypothetical protein
MPPLVKKREEFTTTKGTKRHEKMRRNALPLKLLLSCFFSRKSNKPKVYGTMHVCNRGVSEILATTFDC